MMRKNKWFHVMTVLIAVCTANVFADYKADMEDMEVISIRSGASVGDFFTYADGSRLMKIDEDSGNKVLEIKGKGTARLYNNDDAKFISGFDLSFDFTAGDTGDTPHGNRMVVVRANLADESENVNIIEIALGDRNISPTGNKLCYTDGASKNKLAPGYFISKKKSYTMRIWSDASEVAAGTYNITVTPVAGGAAVYTISDAKFFNLGTSSVKEIDSVMIGQYGAKESLPCTLDNISFVPGK